jgi:hypothetical protein
MYNKNFRHIHRRHNTIKHLLSNEVIFIDYVKSKDNIVDPLTKDLSRELVYNSSRRMGIKLLKDERV